jgi:hypothetical protein
MKKLIASLTAAGLLTFGAAGTAFAAGDNGTGSSGDTPAAGQQARHGVHRRAIKAAGEAAATAIGVTTDELKAAVKGGATIAEFAQSKNVSVDTVTQAIVAALSDKLDQAVANGKVTAERAATVKERLPTLADRFVNHEFGQRGAGQPAPSQG